MGEYSKMAPLRILSFDIECCGRRGHFPDPEHDPVIQIASYLTTHGSPGQPLRVVHVLGTCAPIAGAVLHTFSEERELLCAWRQMLVDADPDWLIGYNTCEFDQPYLINRAETLGIDGFGCWGRVLGKRAVVKTSTFSSKAFGTRESKKIEVPGRVQFDLLAAIRRDYKLPSYTLNAVSAKFLGENKEDVHHSEIAGLHNGTDKTRHRLAVYCLKDAYLPQRLLDRLMMLVNYTEMARVTGKSPTT